MEACSSSFIISSVLGNQVYAPYGTSRYAKGTMGTTKGFTGQYTDTLTGLDYYHARYYDPVAGVFLSADGVQGNLQGVSPYEYVGGNPETKNDPTGHDPDPALIVGFAALLAFGPAAAAISILAVPAIIVVNAPPAKYGPTYSSNGPQPTPAPTPEETPTPEPTPSTDTSGAMCRTGGCYNLAGDEGRLVYTAPNGHQSFGHTIADHVNVSDADVRVQADLTRKQGGSGKYSAFYSLEDAEWAVQYALDHPGTALENQTPGTRVSFSVETGQAIGYGYQKGNPNRVNDITSVTVVAVVGTNGQVTGVVTAYPTLSTYQPQPSPPPSGYLTRLEDLNL